jgi:hypothetical protein
MENKVCRKCNEEKDTCNFNKDKKRKDGLKNFCKTCSNIQRNEWVKNNKEKNDATRKEYSEKNKDRIKLVKQKYRNRIDVIDRTNANKEKNKDKINDRRRELRKIKNELNKIEEVFLKEGEKQCTKCKEIKLSSEFSKNKHSKDGYYPNCKDCKKRTDALYAKKNKDKLALINKKWTEKNKDKVREYKNSWKRYKRKNDLMYILKDNIRTRISLFFRKRGFDKKESTENILGCKFEFLKDYIELKFEDWMNWDNRGLYNGEFNFGWDIDHIIPISSAKTEEDIIRLNHYTNLQPLCSKINRDIKKDHII